MRDSFLDFLGDVDDDVSDEDLTLGWDDLGDLDMVSGEDDDEVGWDELGAARARARARGRGGRGMTLRQRAVLKRQARAAAAASVLSDDSGVEGVPSRQPVVEPLGSTVVVFTAGSGTTLQSTATPQKKCKPARLVVDEVRAATATGLVSIASIKIGSREALISAQPVPARMYGPGAFGVALRLIEAGPGIIITITYVISAAPVMAETVTISGGFNCLTME